MELKPIRDFVAVTKNDAPKQTASGLFVADLSDDKVMQGTVVAVGSGHIGNSGSVVPLEVSVGDTIAFSKSSALEMRVGDASYLMVREENILCSVK